MKKYADIKENCLKTTDKSLSDVLKNNFLKVIAYEKALKFSGKTA